MTRRLALHAARLLAIVIVGATFAALPANVAATDEQPPVVRVEISGEIDLGLPPFLRRVLRDAAQDGTTAVILEIDTPGGRLDAVLQLRDLLLETDLRTVAYINRTAFSAGALIALAATDIVMAPGAVIGAATPVQGDTGEVAHEKIFSAVRSTFRATATERGRDPTIAEAMVDPAVAIPGVVAAGELLTLTDREAANVGYRDATATSINDVLTHLERADTTVRTVEIAPAERLARVLTGSVIAPLLLSFGLIVLISNVLSGSIGLASLLGAGAIGLFLFGHLVAGLAGVEDVLLILLGIVLLGIEVLAVPGFGIFGIAGLLALLSGATLAMLGRQLEFVATADIVMTIGTLVLVFAGTLFVTVLVATLLGSRRGPDGTTRNWARWLGDGGVLATDTAKPPPSPTETTPKRPTTGAHGIAVTDLRPSGVAVFAGRRIDVVTDGEYLDRDTPLVVIRAEQFRSVVARDTTSDDANQRQDSNPPPQTT